MRPFTGWPFPFRVFAFWERAFAREAASGTFSLTITLQNLSDSEPSPVRWISSSIHDQPIHLRIGFTWLQNDKDQYSQSNHNAHKGTNFEGKLGFCTPSSRRAWDNKTSLSFILRVGVAFYRSSKGTCFSLFKLLVNISIWRHPAKGRDDSFWFCINRGSKKVSQSFSDSFLPTWRLLKLLGSASFKASGNHRVNVAFFSFPHDN